MGTNRKYIVAFGAVFATTSLLGQGHEIEVTGSREVEKAYRTGLTPRVVDTSISTPMVAFPLLELKFEVESEVSVITPASISTKERLSQLYSSYIKAGVGTELMPLGEYYFDSKRSRKYIYGAHAKHLSSFGNLKGYAPAQFDRTGVGLYGGINEKRYSLRGDVHYNNQGLHYYGYPTDADTIDSQTIRQRYNDWGFGTSFFSHRKDSAKLNYSVGLNYNNFVSLRPKVELERDWRARENFFSLSSRAKIKKGKETYAVDFNVNYNGYKYGVPDSSLTALDTGLVSNNTLVNLHPTITTHLQDDRFKAKIGLDLVFNSLDKVNAHIYPDLEIKYSMLNDMLIPYAGLRGGMKQTSFKSLTGENEFILSNVQLKNENTSIDFFGGVKGTLSKQMSFNVGVSFSNIKNKALFVTDTIYSIGNQFQVVYDTMNVAFIEGSIAYQLNEKLKIDALGRLNSYTLNNNSYAWNLPQLQVVLRGAYNLFDKFLLNLDLDLEHGRKALVFGPGEGVTLENNQYIETLNFIVDANFGVEYRYSKRVSAFIQFNNFASQRYQRWYNAPVQSFQAMGGVTFRF
jgi:hypothetical protein